MAIEPNTRMAVKFLLSRVGFPALSFAHVDPDTRKKGVFESLSFPHPIDRDKLTAAIESRQGRANIYYSLNPLTRPLNKKAERTDIAQVVSLHVDLDPRVGEPQDAARQRIMKKLESFHTRPSTVIASGGGIQAIWDLEEPIPVDGDIERAEDAKLYNVQLERELEGDNCHNIDRILRLPGTINVADEKKQRRGRQDALATIVWQEGTRYPLSRFLKAAKVQDRGAAPERSATAPAVRVSGNVERYTLDEVEDNAIKHGGSLHAWIRQGILEGRDDANPERWPSRSECSFAVACELVRAGVEDDVIYSVLTDPDYKVSACILDKKDVDREARRTIERAQEAALDPHVAELNKRHFVTGNYGGRCPVGEERIDPQLGMWVVSFQTFPDFKNRYNNQFVELLLHEDKSEKVKQPDGTTKIVVHQEEKKKLIEKGQYWLDSPFRRQYDRVCFAPNCEIEGAYNLWRGYGVEARPGNCQLYLELVRQLICGGDETLYQYVINWMARTAQHPDTRGEVALALRGKEGVGKGMFARHFGKLFGQHYKHLTHPEHLTGKFNAHNADAVVIFADEAFFAGDRRHDAVLKSMITEPTVMMEQKHFNAVPLQNFAHLIMASNDDWIVRASAEARRYCVLDVAAARMQDAAYFREIEDQMASGGWEALLWFLLRVDLGTFDVRRAPQTDALRDQKEFSLPDHVAWWENKLQLGQALPGLPWESPVIMDALLNEYTDYVTRQKGRPMNAIRLYGWVRKACLPPTTREVYVQQTIQERIGGGQSVSRHGQLAAWQLPPLDECRMHWTATRPGVAWLTPMPALNNDGAIPF